MSITANRPVAAERTRPPAALLALGAVVTPLLVWLVAGPVCDVDLQVGQGSDTVTVGPAAIVVVGLLASAAALGLTTLLSRRSERARALFLVVACVVLLVSLLGPLGAATASAGLALAAMHVVVAGVLIPGCARRIAPRDAGMEHHG